MYAVFCLRVCSAGLWIECQLVLQCDVECLDSFHHGYIPACLVSPFTVAGPCMSNAQGRDLVRILFGWMSAKSPAGCPIAMGRQNCCRHVSSSNM